LIFKFGIIGVSIIIALRQGMTPCELYDTK